MYSGIVWCLIGYFDYHSIIFLGVDHRPWEHTIDRNNVFALTNLFNFSGLNLNKSQQALT